MSKGSSIGPAKKLEAEYEVALITAKTFARHCQITGCSRKECENLTYNMTDKIVEGTSIGKRLIDEIDEHIASLYAFDRKGVEAALEEKGHGIHQDILNRFKTMGVFDGVDNTFRIKFGI